MSDEEKTKRKVSWTTVWRESKEIIWARRGRLTILAFAATAPVFDGPEDRNGLRNAAEIGLWPLLLDGTRRTLLVYLRGEAALLDAEDPVGDAAALFRTVML